MRKAEASETQVRSKQQRKNGLCENPAVEKLTSTGGRKSLMFQSLSFLVCTLDSANSLTVILLPCLAKIFPVLTREPFLLRC